MRPDWNLIFVVSLALGLFTVLMLYVRREVRRHPVVPAQETGPLVREEHAEPLRRAMALPLGPQRTARKSTWMKIYLVTIADAATINMIDASLDEDTPLYIGDKTSYGPVAEIQEYVNVDS